MSDSSVRAGASAGGSGERPTIDGYDLHEEVHRGGQGVVYRATQRGTRRQVAVKVLLEGPFASASARRRFEREIELAASLRHPSIVTILESGLSRGRYFFAMDYIDGQRLDAYLRDKRPGFEETLQLFVQIAEAVNYAHQRGVIHRDLKPSNILITEGGTPHVLDFGLAKSAAGDNDPDPDRTTIKVLSTAGQVLGTLAYMSPEQARGAQDVDVRSDVYALGVIFYEALLERMPYDVSGPLGDILNRITHDEPYRPRQARGTSRFGRLLDDEMETILLKSLDKEPERRYQTAGSLARDITRYLNNEPIIAKPASGLYMLRKLLKRYRLQAIAAAAVLTTLLVCLVILVIQYRGEVILRTKYAQSQDQAKQAAEAALKSARIAEEAEFREREQREAAEANADALAAANAQLRQSLLAEMLRQGEVARLNGNLADARDSFWEAFLSDEQQAAAQWALRQYYLESGDDQAVQLTSASDAGVVLSPTGGQAAIAGPHGGLSIVDTDSARPVRWLATHGPAETVTLLTSGAVAAAGTSWVDVWSADDPRPIASFSLSGSTAPHAIRIAEDLSVLYVVFEDQVLLYGTARRALIGGVALDGAPRGMPLLLEDEGALLLPTTKGLAYIERTANASVNLTYVWQGTSARAVTATDDKLILLADGVYVSRSREPMQFQQQIRLRESFDLVAANRDASAVAVASHNGRVVTIRNGRQDRYWQMTRGRVEALRWDPETAALLTLDHHATLTRWIRPEQAAERTRIDRRSPTDWAISADGSTALLMDTEGRMRLYQRGARRPRDISPPGFLTRLAGRNADATLFALDETGRTALLFNGRRVWLHNAETREQEVLRWRLPRMSRIKHLDLAWDGRRAAFCTQNLAEDRQEISIRKLGPNAGSSWVVYDLAGSTVQNLTFLPRSHMLLATRSNGTLVLIDPDRPQSGPREVPSPWLSLDAPVTAVAFSRDATHLAVACDDGRIRVLDPATGEETSVVRDTRTVRSLGFDPSGTVLLVRFQDGTLDLYDFRVMQRILRWNAAAGRVPLASWFGEDALLLTDDNGVLMLGFAGTDERMRRNRGFALQRAIAREAADGNWRGAWDITTTLEDTRQRDQARAALLEQILSNRRLTLPTDWQSWLDRVADPDAQLRLGHAAYRGERFALADQLLGAADLVSISDRFTDWRRAECAYLLGRHSDAITRLQALLQEEQVRPASAARMRLELISALLLHGEADQAAQQLTALGKQANRSGRGRSGDEAMAMMATNVIGNLLLENEAESQVSTSFRNLLTAFKTQWLDYRDDIEFFAGELERIRGNERAATARYQRCLELARDEWPANWARQRLMQQTSSRTTE